MPALSLLNNTFFNPHPEIITNVTNLKFKLTWIWYFFPTFIDPSIYTNIYIYAAAPINMYIDTYIICGWFYKPPSFPGGAVNLGEWHWNMYNIIYETTRQSRFDAWYWMLGAGALGPPRGMVLFFQLLKKKKKRELNAYCFSGDCLIYKTKSHHTSNSSCYCYC